LLGGVVGMFFMPFGLLLGPLAGTFVFEMLFAKNSAKPKHPGEGEGGAGVIRRADSPAESGMMGKARSAGVSGIGSVFGVVTGLAVKLAIGILMILWLFIDIFWIG
jgi:uncharacterized protein YqgC (DUF456 family)